MSQENQKTIAKAGQLSGIGLHTGENVSVFFKPAPPDSGITFFKNGRRVEINVSGASASEESLRCSAIGQGDQRILTVEHLLSAIAGLQISNMTVEVQGPEIPGLDGSALDFVRFFKELGFETQSRARAVYKIEEPIICYESNKAVAVYPDDHFSVSYIFDYDHPALGTQKAEFNVTPAVFEKEIAPARTFCTEEEAAALRKKGFGKGANFENTLVFSKTGVIQNKLRFDNECARHKVLDLTGDLALLGFPIIGKVVGLRSGHALNQRLVEAIQKQRGTMEKSAKSSKAKAGVIMDVDQIKEVLPHRYPFLLVDRIVELEEQQIVGIKNVTIGEPFFQGHFPGRPVMPGVLIVEALAQVGGVLMLSQTNNRGKLAYLVSINNARFRKTVVPGDTLRLEIRVLKLKSKIGVVKGVATVEGEEVCDAEIMFTLVD